jgi:hypothetical protein
MTLASRVAVFISRLGPNSVQAIVVLLVLVGAAYATGVLVVMVTFWWPTTQLIQNVRARRLETYEALDGIAAKSSGRHPMINHLRHLFTGGLSSRDSVKLLSAEWWTHDARWWHQVFSRPKTTAHDLNLALSVGRACGVQILSQGRDLGFVGGPPDGGVLKMNAFK